MEICDRLKIYYGKETLSGINICMYERSKAFVEERERIPGEE